MTIDINLVQIITLLVTTMAALGVCAAVSALGGGKRGAILMPAIGVPSAIALALVWWSYQSAVSHVSLSEPIRVYSAAIKEITAGTEGGGLTLYGFSYGFSVMKGSVRAGETVYELLVDEDGSGTLTSKTVKATDIRMLEDAPTWAEARIETYEYRKVVEGTWFGMTVTGTSGLLRETEVHVPAGAVTGQNTEMPAPGEATGAAGDTAYD